MSTLKTVTECPVCGNGTFATYLECEDYLVSHQKFDIKQCTKCEFRMTNPHPDEASIGAYYKSEEYVSHNDNGGGVMNTAYRLVRNYTLRAKLKLINRLNSNPGTLLDVGCGTGSFLQVCREGGWQITGMEPDPDARTIAQKKLQAEIKPDLKSLTGGKTFDVITLWHVLEHIADLTTSIEYILDLLTPRGTLIVAVPNSDSYDAKLFKQYWAAYDVPRHLHHFTPSTIDRLFNKHGFKLVEQLPMVFDAFYIALLSTKYQSGKTDYLKSVQIGLSSNAQAQKTGNSSSQIYIFKKA